MIDVTMWTKTPELAALIARVREHCEEDGGCWIWQRGFSNTNPAMRLPDRGPVVNVRRHLLVTAGFEMEGRLATTSCGDLRCVAPHHAIGVTRARLQRLTAARTYYAAHPVRRAKLSAAARARVGIGDDLSHAIVESDLSPRAAARHFGVCLSTVQRHRAGKLFDASNPFAALIALAA